MHAPSSGAVLVVTSGHQAGTRYAIAEEQLTIGRHPDSDIFLDDITVSRRHVELKIGSTGYVLSDVGSLNGTYLNGERLEATEAILTNGDDLQIGKFKLLYLVSWTS
jgi:pSer/pThr/pTyr-binding forkhead associated (FHA) protein